MRQRQGDGGGCMYAFRICWCVVSEVVWVRFCTECQPMGAAGLSWGLSPSLTLVGRAFLSFFSFTGKQMSPATFFLTHTSQPIAASGRLTTSPSHRTHGTLMINKPYAIEAHFKAKNCFHFIHPFIFFMSDISVIQWSSKLKGWWMKTRNTNTKIMLKIFTVVKDTHLKTNTSVFKDA